MEGIRIIEQLEQIADDFCTHYCKYPEKYHVDEHTSDEELDKFYEEVCYDCPLLNI